MKKQLMRKIMITLTICFVFIVGINIPLPGIIGSDYAQLINSHFFSRNTALMGLNLSHMSIFSLGLSPWLSVSILWRIIKMFNEKKFEYINVHTEYLIKIGLTLSVGVMQGVTLLHTISNVISIEHKEVTMLIQLVLMLTGTLVLTWLASLNTYYGVGGQTIIIIMTILLGMSNNFKNTPMTLGLVIILGILILYCFVATIIHYSEIRLPMKKILVDSNYHSYSYIPIPLNGSSGMPFMYSLILLMMPQYVLELLKFLFPNQLIIVNIIDQLDDPLVSTALLIFVIVSLTIMFNFFNINPAKLTENMEQSGDYFPGIAYGNETYNHLRKTIWFSIGVESIFNVVIAIFPVIVGIFSPELSKIANLGQMFVIFIALLIVVIDDFNQKKTSKDKISTEKLYKQQA